MIDNFYIIKKFKNRHYTPARSYTYSEPIFGNLGEGSDFLEKSITFPEISNAINSSKSNSAPGIDAIHTLSLKNFQNQLSFGLWTFIIGSFLLGITQVGRNLRCVLYRSQEIKGTDR